jgi:hypothetical protein
VKRTTRHVEGSHPRRSRAASDGGVRTRMGSWEVNKMARWTIREEERPPSWGQVEPFVLNSNESASDFAQCERNEARLLRPGSNEKYVYWKMVCLARQLRNVCNIMRLLRAIMAASSFAFACFPAAYSVPSAYIFWAIASGADRAHFPGT